MTARSPEVVTGELHAEREALVASLAEVRQDVHGEIAQKRALVLRSIPFVAGPLLLLAGSLVARRVFRGRPSAPVERLRIGRFALIERRRS